MTVHDHLRFRTSLITLRPHKLNFCAFDLRIEPFEDLDMVLHCHRTVKHTAPRQPLSRKLQIQCRQVSRDASPTTCAESESILRHLFGLVQPSLWHELLRFRKDVGVEMQHVRGASDDGPTGDVCALESPTPGGYNMR